MERAGLAVGFSRALVRRGSEACHVSKPGPEHPHRLIDVSHPKSQIQSGGTLPRKVDRGVDLGP